MSGKRLPPSRCLRKNHWHIQKSISLFIATTPTAIKGLSLEHTSWRPLSRCRRLYASSLLLLVTLWLFLWEFIEVSFKKAQNFVTVCQNNWNAMTVGGKPMVRIGFCKVWGLLYVSLIWEHKNYGKPKLHDCWQRFIATSWTILTEITF